MLVTGPRGLPLTWWWCYCLCPWHKPTELAHSFLFCSCVYVCLYGLFNCISFHKVSRQLSVFSLCSSGPISALLVLSTTYLFMKASISPHVIPSGWRLKNQLTNCLSSNCLLLKTNIYVTVFPMGRKTEVSCDTPRCTKERTTLETQCQRKTSAEVPLAFGIIKSQTDIAP